VRPFARPAALLFVVGCPKAPTVTAPLVGWHPAAEGATFACYHPVDFAKLDDLGRKTARGQAMDEMMSQWKGKRGDGITFEEGMLDGLETVMLGDMGKVEGVANKNLDWCKKVSTGQAQAGEWESWLRGLPAKLTEGECFTHFDYTLFDYLEIDTGWQRELPICKGDKVRISGTTKDKFRITDKGAWITVEGDPSAGLSGDLPCNFEGCKRGQLILRFRSDAGVEVILPVGGGISYVAPEHGTLSYRINDDTFYDNTWYQSGGIIDHASVEISPE
jgi:hypothetical protein